MRKRTNLYFLLSVIIILISAYIIYRFNEAQEFSRLQTEKMISVSLAGNELTDWISQALHEIKYLSRKDNVISFIDEPTLQKRSRVAYGFSQLSAATAIYDQIRLLDLTGMELIRVDYKDGAPVIIPEEELQDKSYRYYFIECKKLYMGEFYISPLDLNIEGEEIEIPYKPVIRICTPVADRSGNIKGLLIMNYLASRMLEGFSEFDENLMLVNADGFWLRSPNTDDEWGFMFDNDENFASRYPEEWLNLFSSSSGYFMTENGLWEFSTVDPLKDALKANSHLLITNEAGLMIQGEERYFWKVISQVPPETLNSLRINMAYPILLGSLVLFPLVYLGIWNLNRRIELERQTDAHIRFMATHDTMTGLFNRAFFEAEMERLTSSRSYPISVFVLDVNNLKKVNDTFGHHEGDKLIINTATVLKDSFRTDDIVARVGGDEFIVLMPRTDQATSKEILQRLQDNINVFNQQDGIREVDLAIGIATSEEMEDLKLVLQRADEQMYAMKAEQKKQNQV